MHLKDAFNFVVNVSLSSAGVVGFDLELGGGTATKGLSSDSNSDYSDPASTNISISSGTTGTITIPITYDTSTGRK